MADAPGVAVIAYLNTALAAAGDTARARARVPSPRPTRFVRVMLAGSQPMTRTHVESSVVIECWDTDAEKAYELAWLTFDLLSDMDTGDAWVPGGEDGWVGGPAYLEDPEAGVPRYVATVVLRQRRDA